MAEQGVHPRFFKHPVLQGAKSRDAGREIYEDEDYIEIRVAGHGREVHVGPVTDTHKARFPEEWNAFQSGQTRAISGTPVNRWPQLTPSQVLMLESLNVWTVEDMATLSDAGVQAVGMGGYKLRDDARKFLSHAQTAADVGKLDELREQIQAKDAELAAQGQQIASQGQLIAALQEQMAKLMAAPTVDVVAEPVKRRKSKETA